MKRAKIITAIICLIIDIAICWAVCIKWHSIGCGAASLIAAIVFYSVGCFGLYIFIVDVVRLFRHIEREHNPYAPDDEDDEF